MWLLGLLHSGWLLDSSPCMDMLRPAQPRAQCLCREHVLAENKRNQRVGKALKGCWRTGTLLEDDAGQLEAYFQVACWDPCHAQHACQQSKS